MTDETDRELGRRVRRAYRSSPLMEAGARDRLLASIRSAPRPARRLLPFALPGPRVVRVLAAVAGAAAVVLWLASVRPPDLAVKSMRPHASPDRTGGGTPGPDAELVSFQIEAAGAERVVLVGDFNGWDPQAAPMQRAGTTDTWAVTVAVPSGRHLYAFLVNGRRWLADPVAPLAPEDGFGIPNSVVIVGGFAAS